VQTKSMSIFARENLFEFDKFAYGSAASTLLFLIIGLLTIAYIRLGRLSFEGGR
ncbi:MAG: sugar ABC transporter permease, partial [Mesorhizobium sp.]